MASCPKCSHRPITRVMGVRKCRRCGPLVELNPPLKAAQ